MEKLQSIIDVMSDSFTRFSNQVTVSHTLDSSTQLESGLRETTAKIAELQKSANIGRRESSDDSCQGSTASLPSSEARAGLPLRARRSDENLTGPTPSTHQTAASQEYDSLSLQDLPFGYTIVYEPTEHHDLTASPDQPPTPDNLALQPLPSPTTFSPQPPYTYSFRELSFGHWLERACLERGVQILANGHLRPAEYRRAFRISRHFASRERLLRSLRKFLDEPVIRQYGDLELNLGGAGLHYPSPSDVGARDDARRLRLKAVDAGNYEYSARARLVAVGLPITAEVEADLKFYEGVWFDMKDVEGYLLELGIHVDPNASVVEAEVETLQWLWQDEAALDRGFHVDVDKALDRFPGGSDGSPTEQRSIEPNDSTGFTGVAADVNAYMANELSAEEWQRFCNSTIPWLSDVALGEVSPDNSEASGEILKSVGERVAIDVQRLANGIALRPRFISRVNANLDTH